MKSDLQNVVSVPDGPSDHVECWKCTKCGFQTVRTDPTCDECGNTWFTGHICETPSQCCAHGCLNAFEHTEAH